MYFFIRESYLNNFDIFIQPYSIELQKLQNMKNDCPCKLQKRAHEDEKIHSPPRLVHSSWRKLQNVLVPSTPTPLVWSWFRPTGPIEKVKSSYHWSDQPDHFGSIFSKEKFLKMFRYQCLYIITKSALFYIGLCKQWQRMEINNFFLSDWIRIIHIH